MADPDPDPDPDAEIFIEQRRVGHSVEVRAVSSGDGLEVSFVAPADTPESDLASLARSKLSYVRRRRSETDAQDSTSTQLRNSRGGELA